MSTFNNSSISKKKQLNLQHYNKSNNKNQNIKTKNPHKKTPIILKLYSNKFQTKILNINIL